MTCGESATRLPDDDDEMLLLDDRDVFGLSRVFIRLVHEASLRFCIPPEGVTVTPAVPTRVRSLMGVLQLGLPMWALLLLLLSGEIMDETARFSLTLVGVRSKLKARFTWKIYLACTEG